MVVRENNKVCSDGIIIVITYISNLFVFSGQDCEGDLSVP